MEQKKLEQTLKYFAKKGYLLDKEALDFFVEFNDDVLAEEILNKLFSLSQQRLITKNLMLSKLSEIRAFFKKADTDRKILITDFFGEIQEASDKIPEKPRAVKTFTPKIKILSSNIIPYRKIEVKDFVTHFKNRYNFFKDLLMERKELENLISINKIGNNRNFSLIGLVASKRLTKNKNIILEIEDLTGRISALITPKKEEIFNKAKEIILDDVIGFKCSGGGEIVYINDLFFADSFMLQKNKTEEEVYALFVSDMHVGSKLFLEKNFEKFLDWINGEVEDEKMREKIEKIRYLFITGDNIDGIGVYPGQESFLNIKDIKAQYQRLFEFLEKIPDYITIIMCPGQHDAVRVPEPQPPIDEEFGLELTKMDNLFLVSNPAFIEIEAGERKKGIKVLIYHGASMHSWIDEIEDLRQGQANLYPTKVVKYMLRHRHLSPMHSGNVYVPSEKEDMLVIKEPPDILALGDMHRTDVDIYNNTLMICSSCWQSQTPFEEKVGNIPDPCKVPMLNLKTREIKILDFN
jgi:DNA polymerase II small subunit